MSGRTEKAIYIVAAVVALLFVGLMEAFRRDCKSQGGVPITSKFICLSPSAVFVP